MQFPTVYNNAQHTTAVLVLDEGEDAWIRENMTPRQVRTLANYYRDTYKDYNIPVPKWHFKHSWADPPSSEPDFSIDYNLTSEYTGERIHPLEAWYWSEELQVLVCRVYKVMSSSITSFLPLSLDLESDCAGDCDDDAVANLKATVADFDGIKLDTKYAMIDAEAARIKHGACERVRRAWDRADAGVRERVVVVRDPVQRFASTFRWVCHDGHWRKWECKIGPTSCNFTQFYHWYMYFESEHANKHRTLFPHTRSQPSLCTHDPTTRHLLRTYKLFTYNKGEIEQELTDYAHDRRHLVGGVS